MSSAGCEFCLVFGECVDHADVEGGVHIVQGGEHSSDNGLTWHIIGIGAEHGCLYCAKLPVLKGDGA